MTRFSGKIGYNLGTVESPPGSGIHVEQLIEKPYFGDVERSARRYQNEKKINNDVVISNSISVVADAFANENFYGIVYVVWQGRRWTVESVEIKPPRLVLQLGSVYNGATP